MVLWNPVPIDTERQTLTLYTLGLKYDKKKNLKNKTEDLVFYFVNNNF